MPDLPDQDSLDGLHTRKARTRRLSYASQNSTQSFKRQQLLVRTQTSAASVRSVADSEDAEGYVLLPRSSTDGHSEIHSPVPRRHLLLQTESQQWLRAPPLSPISLRQFSPPMSPYYAENSSLPPRRPYREGTLSSSSLSYKDTRQSILGNAGFRQQNFAESERIDVNTGAGKSWIRWMHKNGMRNWVVPCAILASAWVKWCIGLGSYSGAETPPMFGDYEAQRHWMELTTQLPIRQWYTYDLQYWGLDYPPLTAYHSWLCGVIGSWVDPTWFELDKSRGMESPSSKVFMRATVLVSDFVVYIPALLLFLHTWHRSRSRRTQNFALLTLLLQPSLLLIDSGHFQFNSIMLGFTLLSLGFFANGQDMLGALCFVLSLGFKQMALYYAPAIGAYLLGKCLHLGYMSGLELFLRLGLTTIISFAIIFLPFLPPLSPLVTIMTPILRIFPFGRGLFEDKVANFWCASNVVFKWKLWASTSVLVKLSALLTAIGFLPAVFGLIAGGIKTRDSSDARKSHISVGKDKAAEIVHTPTLPLLPYALLTSSLSFFLFSFQVHEKTILLPLLPITLLFSGASADSSAFEWGVLINNVAVFSMWPLLKKDGLAVQYVAVTVLWNWVIGYNPFRLRALKSFVQFLSLAVYSAMISIHILELIMVPPTRYPDIFAVLNVLISTPVFVLTWLWSIKRGMEVLWALGGVSSRSQRPSPGKGDVDDSSSGKRPP